MIIQRHLFVWLSLLFAFHYLSSIPLTEQFRQAGYTERVSKIGILKRRLLEIFCPERMTIATGQGTIEDNCGNTSLPAELTIGKAHHVCTK